MDETQMTIPGTPPEVPITPEVLVQESGNGIPTAEVTPPPARTPARRRTPKASKGKSLVKGKGKQAPRARMSNVQMMQCLKTSRGWLNRCIEALEPRQKGRPRK